MSNVQSINAKSAKRGSISAEFALVAALLLIPTLAALVDLGRLVRTDIVLNRAAREGAICLMRSEDYESAIDNYIAASGLDPAQAVVTLSGGSGADNALNIAYQVPNCPMIPIPGLPLSDTVNVTAVYNRP